MYYLNLVLFCIEFIYEILKNNYLPVALNNITSSEPRMVVGETAVWHSCIASHEHLSFVTYYSLYTSGSSTYHKRALDTDKHTFI